MTVLVAVDQAVVQEVVLEAALEEVLVLVIDLVQAEAMAGKGVLKVMEADLEQVVVAAFKANQAP